MTDGHPAQGVHVRGGATSRQLPSVRVKARHQASEVWRHTQHRSLIGAYGGRGTPTGTLEQHAKILYTLVPCDTVF